MSDHGNWRHLHWHALLSAYNMSPFLSIMKMICPVLPEEIYISSGIFNLELNHLVCHVIRYSAKANLKPLLLKKNYPIDFTSILFVQNILLMIPFFSPESYYQVIFRKKYGFLPNLSDCRFYCFNMDPNPS